MTRQNFRPYEPDQLQLLPQNMREWLPEGHLVQFVSEVVDMLDLSEIEDSYDSANGGQPPYHPHMMTKLIVYGYSTGMTSSRKIEKATHESIPFRVLAVDQHPDHDTIAAFRERHLMALAKLFVQILEMCRDLGLAKLGLVAIDGSKVRANASKHKAMSYERTKLKEEEMKREIERLLEEARKIDEQEDQLYGKGKRGDELPDELKFKERRLKKILEAKAALEERIRARAEQKAKEEQEKKTENKSDKDDHSSKKSSRKKASNKRSNKAEDKMQYNFTDPESRIMKDGSTKSFEQCYNAQVAVDAANQVIVACGVTDETNDKKQIEPMIEEIIKSNEELLPAKVACDSGYFSEKNILYLQEKGIDPYVATGRKKHSEQPPPAPRGRIPDSATVKERMSRKLNTRKGKWYYGKRKEVAEPAIGQIKSARNFWQFSLRGLAKVRAEWSLVCTVHNLLKIFKFYYTPNLKEILEEAVA